MTGQGEPEDGCHRRHVQVEHGVLAAYAVCDLGPQSRVLRQRCAYHQILVGRRCHWSSLAGFTGYSGTLKRSRRRVASRRGGRILGTIVCLIGPPLPDRAEALTELPAAGQSRLAVSVETAREQQSRQQ